MHPTLSYIVALSLLTEFIASAWPNPEQIQGTIPGSINSTLDLGLIRRRSDGKLFLYTTQSNLIIFTFSSLYGPWTKESNTALYNHDSDDLGSGNHGAPALYHLNDTFYLFHNGHDGVHDVGHDGQIGVATSQTLEPGSWDISPGYLNIPGKSEYNILDAALLPSNASLGQPNNLLTFGSYQNGIFNIRLSDPPTAVPEPKAGMNLAFNETGTGRNDTEGAYQFYYDGWYYLFFSSGECCKRSGEAGSDSADWHGPEDSGQVYKVMVCRSEEPRSGYLDKEGKNCLTENGGTMFLGTHDDTWAPGGQGWMYDEEVGGVIMYHHYVVADQRNAKDIPYRFGWNMLDFSSGWPVLVETS